MPEGQASIWPKVQHEHAPGLRLRLLPTPQDMSEFLQFIYPLRARAVTVLSLIHMAYAVADTATVVFSDGNHVTPKYITSRTLRFVFSAILFISASWAGPKSLSILIHVWFVLLGLLRYWTVVDDMMTDVTTVEILGVTSGVLTMAIGCTMHVDFRLYLGISLIEWGLLMAAAVRAHNTENYNTPKLLTFICGVYFIGIWAVHTVQYNTLMTFLWNKRYRQEKADKDAQQRIEEFHRKHLANTLHEVGTPLQAFVNGIDEIRVRCTQALQTDFLAAISEVLSGMEAAAGLMTLARRRAIAYARVLSEDEELQPRPGDVSVASLVSDCVKIITALVKSRHPTTGLPIEYVIEENVPTHIVTDGDWVAEALSNYMSNAVKFTQEGYVRLTVSLRRETQVIPDSQSTSRLSAPMIELQDMGDCEEQSWIRFEVADTGMGVSDVTMASLFRPLTGLPAPTVGAGLGLLSVRRKVELLGGSVGVGHNEPRGSLFWFEIPLIESPAADIDMQCVIQGAMDPSQLTSQIIMEPGAGDVRLSARQLLADNKIDPSKIRLLLVDDEKMLLKFSTKMFMGLGFQVDQAHDGKEALERMQACAYTAILMDQNMPHLDGLGAVRKFREWQSSGADRRSYADSKGSEEALMAAARVDDATGATIEAPADLCPETGVRPDPLIFMMSASILPSDRNKARDLCIADYFEKPLQIADVAAKIVSHLIDKNAPPADLQRKPDR